jgi:hypothetical protein
MPVSVAVVTVNVVESVSPVPGTVALIVVVPAINEVASPLKPAALLMIATAGAEDVQVTDDVRSCVGPAVYVPVAINC